MLTGIAWPLLLLVVAADIKFHRIPKHLNFVILLLIFTDRPTLLSYGILIWSAYFLLSVYTGGAMGYGDVRLAPATLIAAPEWGMSISALTAPHLLAWGLAATFIALRRPNFHARIPLAPFFALSSALMQAGLVDILR